MADSWHSERADLLSNEPVGETMRSLVFRAPAIARATRNGQFLMVHTHEHGFPSSTGPRPFDVHSVDRAVGSLRIVVRIKGPGTRSLTRLTPGQRVLVNGPFGRHPTELLAGTRRIALVGRGAGISPLVMTAQAAGANGTHVRAYLSARTPDVLPPFVAALVAHDVEAIITRTDDEDGDELVTDALSDDITAHDIDTVLVVGSARLTTAARALSERHGLRAFTMSDANMLCGFGHCMGCAIPTVDGYALVCRDGPTFEIAKLVHAGR